MQLCVAEQSQVLHANVAVIKRLVEHWKGRLKPRRVIVYKLMASDEAKNRVTAIHLLNTLMANGLSYYDDPNWMPRVPGPNGTTV
eukprot:3661430-Prymnesium_polylepis.1